MITHQPLSEKLTLWTSDLPQEFDYPTKKSGVCPNVISLHITHRWYIIYLNSPFVETIAACRKVYMFSAGSQPMLISILQNMQEATNRITRLLALYRTSKSLAHAPFVFAEAIHAAGNASVKLSSSSSLPMKQRDAARGNVECFIQALQDMSATYAPAVEYAHSLLVQLQYGPSRLCVCAPF